jgi:hypothetical protein
MDGEERGVGLDLGVSVGSRQGIKRRDCEGSNLSGFLFLAREIVRPDSGFLGCGRMQQGPVFICPHVPYRWVANLLGTARPENSNPSDSMNFVLHYENQRTQDVLQRS